MGGRWSIIWGGWGGHDGFWGEWGGMGWVGHYFEWVEVSGKNFLVGKGEWS